ncbi:glycogen/starch synthase [Rhizobium sp. AN5]|uniref:glycogen/starch synthase n=1 Tax=Rhizobium sp. AN5 TaxID=1855304 RepID=UPI002B22AF59|nr:glycogen/starch synthase [Rhizobium sp. AN5]
MGRQVSVFSVAADAATCYFWKPQTCSTETGTPTVKITAFSDNDVRFAVLSKVASEIALGALDGWQPDIVHAHDWHAALACFYLSEETSKVPTVLILHNLAFQGQYPIERASMLGLASRLCTVDCLEYYGDISLLKGGLTTAITTVSPTYAREILMPESGMGMHGVLAGRRDNLLGIVHGVGQDVWDPATDP